MPLATKRQRTMRPRRLWRTSAPPGATPNNVDSSPRYRDRARDLGGPTADRKLAKLIEVLEALLAEGRRPIVFCRFIPTANYLQECLPSLLKKVTVVAVTGEYDDEQRKERIAELVTSDPRILVATDCLSEGVNLQEHFDAVVHYDLPWNPN